MEKIGRFGPCPNFRISMHFLPFSRVLFCSGTLDSLFPFLLTYCSQGADPGLVSKFPKCSPIQFQRLSISVPLTPKTMHITLTANFFSFLEFIFHSVHLRYTEFHLRLLYLSSAVHWNLSHWQTLTTTINFHSQNTNTFTLVSWIIFLYSNLVPTFSSNNFIHASNCDQFLWILLAEDFTLKRISKGL